MDTELAALSAAIAAEAQAPSRQRRLLIATAESCTGGMVGAALTRLPGSSAWYAGGVVAYSNALKTSLLGVPPELLNAHGAVSAETARAMAEGARRRCGTDWAVSLTGIAGPGGGSADKPVGTVWIAWKRRGGYARAQAFHFDGDREAVRRQTVDRALAGVAELLP